MEKLDVVVIDADQFSKEALIQIAGRVGRKKQAPNGHVIYYHNGVSLSMMLARKDIKNESTWETKRMVRHIMERCLQCLNPINEPYYH